MTRCYYSLDWALACYLEFFSILLFLFFSSACAVVIHTLTTSVSDQLSVLIYRTRMHSSVHVEEEGQGGVYAPQGWKGLKNRFALSSSSFVSPTSCIVPTKGSFALRYEAMWYVWSLLVQCNWSGVGPPSWMGMFLPGILSWGVPTHFLKQSNCYASDITHGWVK